MPSLRTPSYRPILVASIAAMAFVFTFSPRASHADAPSAASYYQMAIQTMQQLPEPEYGQYTTRLTDNGGLHFELGPDSLAVTLFKRTDTAVNNYTTWANFGTKKTVDINAKGVRSLSSWPGLVPTWPAAFDLIRYGFDGKPGNTTAASHPQAAPLPSQPLATIAVIKAIGPGAYYVEDRGTAICPSGSPGHALQLIPRRDPAKYNLTSVIIDTATTRFCSIRFKLDASIIALGVTGEMQLDFGPVDTYWLVRDTRIAIAVRTFGVQFKHGATDITHPDMTFPATIPETVFASPSPSPKIHAKTRM